MEIAATPLHLGVALVLPRQIEHLVVEAVGPAKVALDEKSMLISGLVDCIHIDCSG